MLIDIEDTKNVVVELDADSLVYRIGGAVDMLGEGKRFAERSIQEAVDRIYEDCGCRKCNIYLGSSTNYRNAIATTQKYKGNREGKERPKYYAAIRAWLVTHYGAKLVHDQEAEDAVGIAAYSYKSHDDFIIGAIDKDLDMIAGWHYNYVTHKMTYIDETEALRRFYAQLVTGDGTDNIPGVYKLLELSGLKEEAHKFKYSRYKKKLIEILSEMSTESEMYGHVKSIYDEQLGLTIDINCAIIEIGRLLWIRRYPNELWVPPTDREWRYNSERN